MSEYIMEPKSLEGKVKVEWHFSNYATKADSNNVAGIDTSTFAKIKNIEDKIPNIINLAAKATLNAKINEIKDQMPNISNLATKTASVSTVI